MAGRDLKPFPRDSEAYRDQQLRKQFGVDEVMGEDYIGEEDENGFVEVLVANGITKEFIAKKLRMEMDAKEQVPFKGAEEEYDENGNLIAKKTKIIYSKKMTAWDIRQRARMDAQKLMSLYPAEKAPQGQQSLLLGPLAEPLALMLNDILQQKRIENKPIDVTPREERQPVRLLSFLGTTE